VCSPALGHRRGEALARALERLQGMGYRIAHVVLTVQHTRGDSLATLRRVLSDVWRRVVGHRRVKALWAGVAWYRSVEITLAGTAGTPISIWPSPSPRGGIPGS
jgi:hypothetical protein